MRNRSGPSASSRRPVGADRAFGTIRSGQTAIGRLVSTYADIPEGEVAALFGSSEHLELAANAVSAAERLQLGRGAPVAVRRR